MKRRPRGTGCIFQPKGTRFLWLKYSHNGKSFRESARTRERTFAGKLLRKRIADLDEGKQPILKQQSILYQEIADGSLTYYIANKHKSLVRNADCRKHGDNGRHTDKCFMYVPGELALRRFFSGYCVNQITTSRVTGGRRLSRLLPSHY